MRHRLSGEYTSVGNLKMDWGQGRRKGVLGALIERLFLLRRYKQTQCSLRCTLSQRGFNYHDCVSG